MPEAWPGSSCGAILIIKAPMPIRPTVIAGEETPRTTGGYDFLADPSQRADHTAIFWHPDEDPTVVLLTAAPAGPAAFPFLPADWAGDVVRIDAADGTHIVIRAAKMRHQLWLPNPVAEGAALAAIIPMDISAPHRAEATIRFWQHATYGRRRQHSGRSPRSERLIPTLRALDGHLAGGSYRTIADGLFGTSRVQAEPWKTSPMRDRVIRLVQQGVSLMQGSYRSLLKPRRRE
jgi:hypothetical protein